MHIKSYFKTSNHETAEATGGVIGNKISKKKALYSRSISTKKP